MSDSSDNPTDLLNAAVAARSAITMISVDGKTVPAQFLAPAGPSDPGAIWASPSVRHTETAKSWAAVNARVSIRFTTGQQSAGAEIVIVKFICDYWLTEKLPISAILLGEPLKVWLDTREYPRYQLRNDGGGIRAALARRGLDRAARAQAPESRASLWDLGLGGAGFLCPFNRAILQDGRNQAYEVTLDIAGKVAVLPARCTHVRAQGNLLRIGLQFDRSIASAVSLGLLEKVVAELEQRAVQVDRRCA